MKKFLEFVGFVGFVAFYLLSANDATGQSKLGSIDGLVIDSVSLQPVSGATVTIEGTSIGAISRTEGQFNLTNVPAGIVVVRVRAIGYRVHRDTLKIRPGEHTSLFVGLHSSPVRQEDVVISASKHVQAMQEVPISTSVIPGSELSSRNTVQLDQVLRYVPGVNLNDNQVNIRGSSGYSRGLGSRVLFLIDGVPMLAGDTGEMKLDELPMTAIDRVEVVKGAGSALYGSSALGGIVNLVTREPDDTLRLYTKIYGGGYPAPSYPEWQWYNGLRTQAGIDVGYAQVFDRLSLTLGAGLRDNNSYRQNDDYHRWNTYSKIGYAFNSNLNAWLSITSANDNHGNWIFWQDAAHALLTSDSTTVYQRIYSFKLQTAAIVKYTPSPSIVSWFRAGLYHTGVDDNIDATGPDAASKLVSHANAFNLEEQITHQVSDRTLLTYGLQSTGNVVKSNYYGDRSQWDAALYAQVEQHPDDHALLTVGLRGTIARTENFAFDGRVDPKFGFSYTVDEDLSLRASAGTGFRSPSVAERFVATRTGTLVTLPNPDLQFERSATYEIGGTKTWHVGETPVTLDGAVFWTDYWNLIEPDFICTLPAQIRFENVTHARIQGCDAHITAPFLNRHLSFSLAYTYMWARDLTFDAPLKYRPRHLITAGVNTRWSSLFAGFDFRFASRVERIDDTVALCINPLTGYSVIPDFNLRVQTAVADARVGIDLHALTGLYLVFTLNAYNLFQYYYVEIPANLAPIRNFVGQLEFTL